MSSNSGDKTTAVKTVFQVGTKPPENEPLPCPRCQSTSTKFCYYNNYNLAQPRYFCKSCRRYWTRGGTLRNVPVGGGTRKSAAVKRSRAAPSTIPSSNPVEVGHEVNVLNLNQTVCEGVTTLVDTEAQAPEPEPIMGLTGDFGSVLDSGSGHGLGFELSTWDWSLGEVGGENDVSGCSTATGGGRVVVSGGGCNTWQVDNVLGDGEYYNWSDLAISTPANGVK